MSGYHATRFVHDPRRDVVWRALWDLQFARYVPPDGCVLELGAGHGHFINAAVARRRIAVDVWPGMVEHLAPGVEAIVARAHELDAIEDGSVDFALASNLFEHMDKAEFAATLAALAAKLAPRGRLAIVQPNWRLVFREYFDDYSHVAVWSDRSLPDFLAVNGWRIERIEPRFLPLSMKSRIPVSRALVRLYLLLPWRPLAGQMLVIAAPARGSERR
ncbi:MAG: class I SAM-dependent methyltransferase [Alphaproteobacteria bacterium]|nr:class I SAM-dependent methyltransferase [Alphaproteobacteria bacterium]